MQHPGRTATGEVISEVLNTAHVFSSPSRSSAHRSSASRYGRASAGSPPSVVSPRIGIERERNAAIILGTETPLYLAASSSVSVRVRYSVSAVVNVGRVMEGNSCCGCARSCRVLLCERSSWRRNLPAESTSWAQSQTMHVDSSLTASHVRVPSLQLGHGAKFAEPTNGLCLAAIQEQTSS